MELFGDLTQLLRSVAPRGMELRPATVAGLDDETGWGSMLSVHVDGDPGGHTVQATNLTGITVAIGARVMVLFDPPSGVYVLGVMEPPAAPAGGSTIYGFNTGNCGPGDDTVADGETWNSSTDDDGSVLLPAGTYLITAMATMRASVGTPSVTLAVRDVADVEFVFGFVSVFVPVSGLTVPVHISGAVTLAADVTVELEVTCSGDPGDEVTILNYSLAAIDGALGDINVRQCT